MVADMNQPNLPQVTNSTIRQFSKAKVIAEKLGVCPRTIFRWADQGRIARHKINPRVVLFDEMELIALLHSARVRRLGE
jgi:hypothetical protein